MPSVSKAAAALSGSPPQTEKPTHYSTSAPSTGPSPVSTGTSSTSDAADPSAGATAPSTTAPTSTAPNTTRPRASAPPEMGERPSAGPGLRLPEGRPLDEARGRGRRNSRNGGICEALTTGRAPR
uniref:Uncharacterized protein n=1 Tax=Ornithorhynchus anatinus TaxID=9258 RepID=A0A6I8NML3_ORNAN